VLDEEHTTRVYLFFCFLGLELLDFIVLWCYVDVNMKRKDYEHMTLSSLEYSLRLKGSLRPKSVGDKVRELNRQWNKRLCSFPCQNCGYDKHVELAHLQAISEFPLETAVREVNHPDNVLVLCRNCHWEFDSGMLSICDIPIRC
jgi:predicted restriction endonuclease